MLKELTWWVTLLCAPALVQAAPAEAPKMGTLRVHAEVEGVPLFIDGERVGESPFSAPWFIEPGAHVIEARPAEGAVERHEFKIKTGEITEVKLLKMTHAARAKRGQTAKTEVIYTGPGFSLTTASYGMLGAGLLATGFGVAFGLKANSKAEEARELNPRAYRRADQLALIEEADSQAFYSNISFGAGGVLLLGGAALLLLSSDSPLKAEATAIPGGQGFGLGGRF